MKLPPSPHALCFLASTAIALSVFAQTESETRTLDGICFSPFRANQSPDSAVYPTTQEIREDLKFIHDTKFARRIRTYSSRGTLAAIPTICQELDLECWAGAWLSKFPKPTEDEIQALIAIGEKKLGNCPVLIVGNEVLLRHDLTEDELIADVKRVRSETGAKVAYADIGAVWHQHPAVAEAVNVILVHLYPYWEGHSIDGAVDELVRQWRDLVLEHPGKPMLIGETGWPSAGEPEGGAIANETNQARYFREFLQASRHEGIQHFYFSMFSESWKGKEEGARGANWGLFTEDGRLKPALADYVSPAARFGMNRLPRGIPAAVPLDLPAFIYREGHSNENRFFPTNWMGDVKDIELDEYCTLNPHSGNECIKFTYSPAGPKEFAGIYWVGPYVNHWGQYPGYIVKGAKKLLFWARGEKGGENVEFKIGGVQSPGEPFRDSFGPLPINSEPTKLTRDWTGYSIDLSNSDTSSLIGGFCAVCSARANPSGCTFYLDDIIIIGDKIPHGVP